MAKKTLTIEGITFPKYSKGSSKRNFRLVFFIQYKDKSKKNTGTYGDQARDRSMEMGKLR